MEEEYGEETGFPTQPMPESPFNTWQNDSQVAQKLLTVTGRLNKDDAEYVELLSDDLASGFCSPTELAVVKELENLCNMVRTYASDNKHNLRPSHNLIGRYHNAIVASSRATGEAARLSRSQYVNSKQSYSQNISRTEKKKGLRRFFG